MGDTVFHYGKGLYGHLRAIEDIGDIAIYNRTHLTVDY